MAEVVVVCRRNGSDNASFLLRTQIQKVAMSILETILARTRNSVERTDSGDGTQVQYQFPLGFTIIATRKGVSFTGTSVNYDLGTLMQVTKAIDWAKQIHFAMLKQQGVPPQLEVEGLIKYAIKGDAAWWKGDYANRVKSQNGVHPLAMIRQIARDKEVEDMRRSEK